MLNWIFLRLLLSQTIWNSERMQNIGFLWSVMPFLKRIYPKKDDLKLAVIRHLNFFNTHPYFMGIFAGITMFWEQKNYELVTKVKISYGGPMAALGTQMFWSTLRPLVGIAAILVTVTNGYNLVPPILFIILYNGIHLPVRYYFIKKSSSSGLDFFYILKGLNPNKLIWYLQIIGFFMALVVAACYLHHAMICHVHYIRWTMVYVFIAIMLGTILALIFFKKISALKIFYFVIFLSIILTFLKIM